MSIHKSPTVAVLRTIIWVTLTACWVMGPVLAAPVGIGNNPYASVNWSTFGQYKGNFHAHTEGLTTQQVIDLYHNAGETVLAITNHNVVTWPWPTPPASQGMVGVKANEISGSHDMNNFFSDFTTSTGNPDVRIDGIQATGGLGVFNHPGRYSYDTNWYVSRFQAHSQMIGMEVFRQGDSHPGDRAKWDQVLTALMPDRPVWGFANDDEHQASHVGLNWNTLLLPALTDAQVQAAMQNGQFYFSTTAYRTDSGVAPPVISSITVDNVNGLVSVSGSGYQQVRWISTGNIISYSPTLDLRNTSGVGSYVRAELYGTGGSSYSNPLAVVPVPEPGTLVLLGIGAMGLLCYAWRRRRS